MLTKPKRVDLRFYVAANTDVIDFVTNVADKVLSLNGKGALTMQHLKLIFVKDEDGIKTFRNQRTQS